MKKLVVMMTLALGAGSFGIAHATIVGSAHDFTDGLAGKGTGGATVTGSSVSEAWNFRGEICRVCHVPHDHSRATQRYLNGLLWNHAVSGATYTMYDNAWSSTINGTQSQTGPDGTAKLCLGCHDGTVAIDTFDKYADTVGTVFLGSSTSGYDAGFRVGAFSAGTSIDLRGTHPISIEFPAVADDAGFNLPTDAKWADGSTVASTLDHGKVQCSTCHDVHNQESVVGTHLLRAGQTTATANSSASGLCLTCHIK